MRRRALLLSAGAALPIPLAGCLDAGETTGAPNGSTWTGTPETMESAPPRDAAEHASRECSDRPRARGPDRGRSDVELDVHDVEYDGDVAYRPGEHEVRFVAAYRVSSRPDAEAARERGETPAREPQYDTTPADRWGRQRCRSAAAEAAAEHVRSELDTRDISAGITSRLPRDEGVTVATWTHLDRECNVVSESDVDYEALVEATPRTVSAAYELEEFEYEMDVPVFARHTVEQDD